MKLKCKIVSVFFLLSVLALTDSLIGSECFAQQVLKIGGTGAALGSMRKMAEEFHKLHPDIDIKVLPSLGSSGGIKAAAGKALDLALSSRLLKDEERAGGLTELEYARSPFVFVTRDPVGATGVTSEDVVQMYIGTISSWPNGQRIRPIIRPNEEADTKIAKSISQSIANALDSLQKVPGIVVALTDQDCSEAIGSVAGALAFTSLTQVMTWNRKFVIFTFNGIAPTVANLLNGSYPYYRPFYLVRKTEGSENVNLFIDFIRSPQGKKILEETGNIAMTGPLAEK